MSISIYFYLHNFILSHEAFNFDMLKFFFFISYTTSVFSVDCNAHNDVYLYNRRIWIEEVKNHDSVQINFEHVGA